MVLTDKQKQFVERLDDMFFTVSFLEHFYNESPMNLFVPGKGNFSYIVMRIREANAFMRAVDFLLKSSKIK